MKKLLLLLTLLPIQGICGDSRAYLKENAFHMRATYQFIKTDHYFDNDGEVQKTFNYSFQTSTVFLEAQYGVSKRVNVGFYFPALVNTIAEFKFSDTTSLKRSDASLGDAELFCKVKFYQTTKSTFVITGRLVTPSGVNDNVYELNSGYGTLSEALVVEYIYKHNDKLYAQAYGGFLHRGNNFTDEVIAGGDIAYRILPNLWTSFNCRAIDPLENGNDAKTGGLPGLGRNNSGYIRLGLEVDLNIGKFDVFARTSYPVKGQFVQAEPVYEAGVGIFFGGKKAD